MASPPTSLRRAILLWLVPATAAIGALALADTGIDAQRTSRDVSDRVLVGSAMAIAEGVDVAASGGLAVALPFSALDMLSSTAQDQVFYRIDGPEGLLTGYGDLMPAKVPPGQAIGLHDDHFRGMAVRTATLSRELTGAEGALPFRVTVAETTRARDALARALLTRSALKIGLLILGAAIVAWAAATYALRPLDRLSERIKARQPHDLSPIDGDAAQELRPVIEALNGFLARLSQAMATLQSFASSANHQIRTPLTVARTQVALAAKSAAPKGGQMDSPAGNLAGNLAGAEALAKADTALIRIERVLEQVLLLARIEATGTGPVLQSLDVAALARAVTSDLMPRAVERHKDLGYEGPASAFARSQEVLLGELLRNLVDNALSHCPPQTLVTVKCTQTATGLALVVEDTGPPLSEAGLAQIAARIAPAQGQGQPRMGTQGLGLAIVAEIARALRADLSVGRGAGGRGLVWQLTLPG